MRVPRWLLQEAATAVAPLNAAPPGSSPAAAKRFWSYLGAAYPAGTHAATSRPPALALANQSTGAPELAPQLVSGPNVCASGAVRARGRSTPPGRKFAAQGGLQAAAPTARRRAHLRGVASSTQSADVVIVGGGHNGLVAATLLARASLHVRRDAHRHECWGTPAAHAVSRQYRVPVALRGAA